MKAYWPLPSVMRLGLSGSGDLDGDPTEAFIFYRYCPRNKSRHLLTETLVMLTGRWRSWPEGLAGPWIRIGGEVGNHDQGLAFGASAHRAPRGPSRAAIAAALERSRRPATRRAYACAWKQFQVWAEAEGLESLPADPVVVAAYLAHRAADGLSVASLALDRKAIRHYHGTAGLPTPTASEGVRQTFAGLRNQAADRGVDRVRRAHLRGKDSRRLGERPALEICGVSPGWNGPRDRPALQDQRGLGGALCG